MARASTSRSPRKPEDTLVEHYDRCLLQHGDTALGADWPNEQDRRTRFDVMLDVIEATSVVPLVLCDLGCGTGEFLAHIRNRGLDKIDYIGVDRSTLALTYARKKFPDVNFIALDVNSPDAPLHRISCDYLVANGLFTIKAEMTDEEMWSFLVSSITRIWPQVRRGIAFNVMSKCVEWERNDLFHASMDQIAGLLHDLAGRRVLLRADYGLYEYTAYAYKPMELVSAIQVPAVAEHRGVVKAVPVMRPQLPAADRLLPYLRRINSARIYSNFGPLTIEFQRKLSDYFKIPAKSIVSASCGTTALMGAVLATAGPAAKARPYALIPAFTFAATAVAVERCGYRAYLADVDADSWMLDPEKILSHPLLDRIGIVVPVAAFGQPVPQAPWLAFQKRTSIPVVIDGAASFDTVSRSPAHFLQEIAVVLSFHATKSFGTGEGGCVMSTDFALVERVAQALNFGFHMTRDSASASLNGKMSEYHAAVGLTELDGWPEKAAALHDVVQRYRRELSSNGLECRFIGWPYISGCYALFLCRSGAEADAIQKDFQLADIDFRFWYGRGLHQQTHFSDNPHDSVDVTEDLGSRLIGLPMAPDLADEAIKRIAATLSNAVRRGIAVK